MGLLRKSHQQRYKEFKKFEFLNKGSNLYTKILKLLIPPTIKANKNE